MLLVNISKNYINHNWNGIFVIIWKFRILKNLMELEINKNLKLRVTLERLQLGCKIFIISRKIGIELVEFVYSLDVEII